MVVICWRVKVRGASGKEPLGDVRARACFNQDPILSYRRWLKKKKKGSDLLLLSIACGVVMHCSVVKGQVQSIHCGWHLCALLCCTVGLRWYCSLSYLYLLALSAPIWLRCTCSVCSALSGLAQPPAANLLDDEQATLPLCNLLPAQPSSRRAVAAHRIPSRPSRSHLSSRLASSPAAHALLLLLRLPVRGLSQFLMRQDATSLSPG